jgi:hypothetical protein
MKDILQGDLYLPTRNPRVTRALLAHYPRSPLCVNGPLHRGCLGRLDQQTEITTGLARNRVVIGSESGHDRVRIGS